MTGNYLKKAVNSIYFSLFISHFLIICIFILTLGLYSYQRTSAVLEVKSTEYNEVIKTSVNKALESYVDELEKITYLIYTYDTQKILNQLQNIEDKHSWEYIDAKNTFFGIFYSWMGFRKFRHPAKRIFIINSNGSYYEHLYGSINPDFNLIDTTIYQKAHAKNGSIVFEIADNEEYLWYQDRDRDTTTLLIARKIINQNATDDLGVMVLAMEWQHVTSVIQEITKEATGEFFIKDSSGQIIFHSGDNYAIEAYLTDLAEDQDAIALTYDDENYIVSSYVLPSTGWTFISVSSLKDINRDMYSIKNLILFLILISLLFGGLISFLFSKSIVRPIRKLQTFAGQIEKGVLDTRIDLRSYNEFNYLTRAFNLMAERLKQVINTNYVLTLQEKEADLKLLHAQINPHFLYNTLNSINAYAQLHDVQEISDMTFALSDILRYSIQSSKELVKVSDEISHIKNYLYIQNIRFNNEINIVLDIQEEILDCKIARFILQPQVENALYHGLELIEQDKKLTIRGYLKDNCIQFEIIDNGIGIDDIKLHEIKQSIESYDLEHLGQEPSSSSIGILNVHRRIRLIFGEGYGLHIYSRIGEGTKIIITLPHIPAA